LLFFCFFDELSLLPFESVPVWPDELLVPVPVWPEELPVPVCPELLPEPVCPEPALPAPVA
jgi:hypothetical protein